MNVDLADVRRVHDRCRVTVAFYFRLVGERQCLR